MDGDFQHDSTYSHEFIRLSTEELAAVEGWRRANMLDSRADALRELVRLGLLSEIGRIYRAVTGSEGAEERSGSA